MKLFDILNLVMPSLKPEECKLHLATLNEEQEDPLDEFLAGQFEEWQSRQTHKNFERPYIVSLIQLHERDSWLFAGVYSKKGRKPNRRYDRHYKCFVYKTEEVQQLSPFTGRLVVKFSRRGRQPYRIAENWLEELQVSELKSRRLEVEDFPGFKKVLLAKEKLDIIVQREVASWKAALSSVAGIYLITDTKTGRHYVGSAYGAGGIWKRWKAYSESGHGNNKNLKRLLQRKLSDYDSNFQFSILETADTTASKDDILERETHWKDALCSRENYGGYNAN
jgi:hypothetical protein